MHIPGSMWAMHGSAENSLRLQATANRQSFITRDSRRTCNPQQRLRVRLHLMRAQQLNQDLLPFMQTGGISMRGVLHVSTAMRQKKNLQGSLPQNIITRWKVTGSG